MTSRGLLHRGKDRHRAIRQGCLDHPPSFQGTSNTGWKDWLGLGRYGSWLAAVPPIDISVPPPPFGHGSEVLGSRECTAKVLARKYRVNAAAPPFGARRRSCHPAGDARVLPPVNTPALWTARCDPMAARAIVPGLTSWAQPQPLRRMRSSSRRRRLLGLPSPRMTLMPGAIWATTGGGEWST